MAARRRPKRLEAEEPENHERWLVSYADFITLLFAFFVVMYAISSVNEGKYRVLSESLEDAFAIQPRSSLPIQVGELTRTTRVIDHMAVNLEQKQLLSDDAGAEQQALSDEDQLLQLAELIRQELSPYIDEKLIEVKKKDFWVEIEMKSAVLFPSGRAALADAALPALNRIATLLKRISNPVFVEGYTDNIPIDTFEFPSNWELSASRAASVVHHFFREGVSPDHLAAIGYGEYHPVADNGTEQGRYQNRRIVVVLMSRAMARHKLGENSRVAIDRAVRNLPDSAGGVVNP